MTAHPQFGRAFLSSEFRVDEVCNRSSSWNDSSLSGLAINAAAQLSAPITSCSC